MKYSSLIHCASAFLLITLVFSMKLSRKKNQPTPDWFNSSLHNQSVNHMEKAKESIEKFDQNVKRAEKVLDSYKFALENQNLSKDVLPKNKANNNSEYNDSISIIFLQGFYAGETANEETKTNTSAKFHKCLQKRISSANESFGDEKFVKYVSNINKKNITNGSRSGAEALFKAFEQYQEGSNKTNFGNETQQINEFLNLVHFTSTNLISLINKKLPEYLDCKALQQTEEAEENLPTCRVKTQIILKSIMSRPKSFKYLISQWNILFKPGFIEKDWEEIDWSLVGRNVGRYYADIIRKNCQDDN